MKTRNLVVTIAVALAFAAVTAERSGFADSRHFPYVALSDELLSHRFPLQFVTVLKEDPPDLELKDVGPRGSRLVSTGTVKIRNASVLLRLVGQDRAAKDWSVEVAHSWGCDLHLGVHLFVADLDHDGVKDLLLTVPTCGNGWSPPVHLIAVTFDEGGRPVPFESEGYFEVDERGVDHLLDLDPDHKAVFVHLTHDDDYWITDLYKASSGRWSRLTGEYRGAHMPMYTRFTNAPNRLPTTPAEGKIPFSPDLSTKVPVESGRLTAWRWPSGNRSDPMDIHALDFQLDVTPIAGSSKTCRPFYWYASARLIVDTPAGRRVVLLCTDPESRTRSEPLLREIVDRHLPVSLFGRRIAGSCSPELVWASGAAASPR